MSESSPPLVMGILNVTPDSFSDGGLYLSVESALRRAEVLVSEGADIIDIGGESTRPGSDPVSELEEMDRVIPVLRCLVSHFAVRLSIDTTKVAVAHEAIRHGATLINDINAGEDIRMLELAKQPGVDLLIMHKKGTPKMMQVQPQYPKGVVCEVKSFFEERLRKFKELGVTADRVWVDPGIGFGKTTAHNLELLRRLDEMQGIGSRIVIGTSRKSFLSVAMAGHGLPQVKSLEERLPGTIATQLWACEKGASVFRVHDVKEVKRALILWEQIHHAG